MMQSIITSFVRFLSDSHIAGYYLSDGIRAISRAQTNGWETTLSYWSAEKETPQQVVKHYLSAMNVIESTKLRCQLSIKPAALGHDISALRDVLSKAKEMGLMLQFDAEHPADAERAFNLFKQSCALYEQIGFTLPARWKRSINDLQQIIAMKKPVRIVKGQWRDIQNAYDHHVRRQFLHLVDMLTESENNVIIGSHDTPLVKEAVHRLTSSGKQCEVEQMFGLPWIKSIDDNGSLVKKRMYIPYGNPSLPYNISFLGERFEIAYWVLRDSVLRKDKKFSLLEFSSAKKLLFTSSFSQQVSANRTAFIMEGKK